MNLAPLLNAPTIVQVHAFTALAVFALGLMQFACPKGTLPHRIMGRIWVALMMLVAISSFWINDIKSFGPWSAIHLLSILTLVSLPIAVHAARHQKIRRHKNIMTGLFLGALVVAGVFTLTPGRIMHDVVFGG